MANMLTDKARVLCGIPARSLPPCDMDWGHDGNMHASAGDGFFARDHEQEHKDRQAIRRYVAAEARKKALEEAAKICRAYGIVHREIAIQALNDGDQTFESLELGASNGAHDCAERIRALAGRKEYHGPR